MKLNDKARILAGSNTTFIGLGILLLRCTIGAILFIVGAGKLFGWFGGFGITATLNFYGHMGIPVVLAYLSMLTEFLGGIFLAAGIFTRPAAAAVLINMLVAFIKSLPAGFLTPGGASFPFTLMLTALSILITGPMNYSVDNLLFKTAAP